MTLSAALAARALHSLSTWDAAHDEAAAIAVADTLRAVLHVLDASSHTIAREHYTNMAEQLEQLQQ